MAQEITKNTTPPVVEVYNPRTGELLYSFQEITEEDVEKMYKTAWEAFEKISAMSVRERLEELDKIKQYLIKNREEIAKFITKETGKCLTDALILELFPAVDQIDYYQKYAEKILKDQKVPTPILLMGKKSKIVYEPLGVILIISPWNYPFHLSFVPFVCAFVAGNSAIIKPSRLTPLKGLYEKIIEESGFMKGALQIAYASRKTANLLIEKKPAKIHFTGSVEVGKTIMRQASQYLIPVELELGGKDPMIVFEDVNLERTVNGAIWGSFTNCGQTCTSVERIFVHEKIYDDFVKLMVEKVKKLRTLANTPDPTDEAELDVGCMTADFQIEEIESQIKEAKEKGCEILCGGSREGKSHAFPPTIVTKVGRDYRIQYHETFGPVVTITPFSTEEEAIQMANDSPYGLSASVWSADIKRAERVARKIVTGNVSINNVLATQANSALPFGGIKDSGFGRYRGAQGLYAFSNVKSILIDRQWGRLEAYWYPYSRAKFNLFSKVFESVFQRGIIPLLKTAWLGLKLEILSWKHRL